MYDWFSFKGRSAPRAYLLAQAVYLALSWAACGYIFIFMSAYLHPSADYMEGNVFGLLLAFLAFFLYAAASVAGVAATIRRLHDAGVPGRIGVVAVVPGFNLLLIPIFALLKSDPADNQYGHPPELLG